MVAHKVALNVQEKQIRLLILGLDNAGKLESLNSNSILRLKAGKAALKWGAFAGFFTLDLN